MLTKSLIGNRNFIPIAIFILWVIGFFVIHVGDFNSDLHWISFGLVVFMVAVNAIVANTFPYFKQNFYFIFLFVVGFLLLTCCLENISFFGGLFFLYLILSQILFKNQHETYFFNAFDLGFYLGLAVIFYPPFWIFGAFLILHFIVLGKTQYRNLIFAILGLISIFFLAFELMVIFDAWYNWDLFKEQLPLSPIDFKLEFLFLIPPFLLGLLGLIDYYSHFNRQSTNKKVVFFDALLWLIFAIIYLILYNDNQSQGFLLVLLPIALFIANYMTYSKKIWKKEIIIWIYIISLVLYKFHNQLQVPELFETVTF